MRKRAGLCALALLLIAALALLLRGPLLSASGAVETTSFGQTSALIEHKITWKGMVIFRRVEQTRMSRLITRYLGSQGKTTTWGLISSSVPDSVADASFGPIAECADRLARFIESSMADDAKRQCLSTFQFCDDDEDRSILIPQYTDEVIATLSKLGRIAQASDLPSDSRVKRQSVGCNTGLLLYEKTWLGRTYYQETIQTDFSKVMERHLGPQPAETDWVEMWAESQGASSDSLGTVIAVGQSGFAELLHGKMTEEARLKCLREYLLSAKAGLAGGYIHGVGEAVCGISRPLQARDIPTFARLREQWAKEPNQPSLAEILKTSDRRSPRQIGGTAACCRRHRSSFGSC